ncbi:MAG: glycosyltransferase family A protein [Desulfuromonadales bacterium]|jgi:glycosyltransferase involved in cell wall biosynthesis
MMTATNNDLAIIIPAYNPRFFETALESLAGQTDQRFQVYVGDDAGPVEIQQIARRFETRLNLIYHRFVENLGGRSLAGHWNRCVALSDSPWVWLFCDDDVADPSCVESFYRGLDTVSKEYDLFRFDLIKILQDGRKRCLSPVPEVETACAFLESRLSSDRQSCVSQYLFSRKIFQEHGGFVEFPMAWCSDDASWFLFARAKGICRIEAPIYWRISGENISSLRNLGIAKFKASAAFVDFILDVLTTGEIETNQIEFNRMKLLLKKWLLAKLKLRAPIHLSDMSTILREFPERVKPSPPVLYAAISVANVRYGFRKFIIGDV